MSLKDDLLKQVTEMAYLSNVGGIDYPVKAIPLSLVLDVLNKHEKSEPGYEYCVMMDRYPDDPHRGPYETIEPAENWVRGALEDGFRDDVFYIARRVKGEWERV